MSLGVPAIVFYNSDAQPPSSQYPLSRRSPRLFLDNMDILTLGRYVYTLGAPEISNIKSLRMPHFSRAWSQRKGLKPHHFQG
jgi:hypothetical protein